MLLDMSTFSASHHTIPFFANPLCFVHFFNSFHQCIQEPVSKRARLTTRSKAKLQVPSQRFFFNVFIVARPAAQPFPILESQTIQKAKRQWITSFNFFVLFELAGWPNCCPAATSCGCPAAASSSSCCQEYPGH